MICYRGMTFCPYYEDCAKADQCHRPLTEEVRTRADEAGLPISHYGTKPTCHEPQTNG